MEQSKLSHFVHEYMVQIQAKVYAEKLEAIFEKLDRIFIVKTDKPD